MVDRWANTVVHPTMEDIVEYVPRQISADTITLVGFAIGLVAVALLWIKLYSLALVFFQVLEKVLSALIVSSVAMTNMLCFTSVK